MNFEQPLPVLDASAEFIYLETKETTTGTLTVKNTGGGTLKGYVAARHHALTFEPDWWEGNAESLRYTFHPSRAGILPGETFETVVYICSNGGEAALPVTIKLTKMAITTRDGTTIANINDFYKYAKTNPSGARQVFTDSEFYMLLLTVGYPYMEVYESLHKDANRERAMDNFFILSGLKEKTELALPERSFVFDRTPDDMTKLIGRIVVEKSDRGFYEAPITMENNAPWLSLSANRLISGDFDAEGRARINFAIDPKKISARYARECVSINEHTAEIIFRRQPFLTARLNRESYRFDDKGTIEVTNNTGGDLAVELFCADSYIRFAAKRYVIGKAHEIPFQIKLSAFMNAGRLLRKTPFMKTTIEVKGAGLGKANKIILPVTVGEW